MKIIRNPALYNFYSASEFTDRLALDPNYAPMCRRQTSRVEYSEFHSQDPGLEAGNTTLKQQMTDFAPTPPHPTHRHSVRHELTLA